MAEEEIPLDRCLDSAHILKNLSARLSVSEIAIGPAAFKVK
jgi:hypothetical protein